MTIAAHPDDETVRIVTEESEIVPALQKPLTRAVFYRRPKLTELFTAAGAIVARRDEEVLLRMKDHFNNPSMGPYAALRRLNSYKDPQQILDVTTQLAIDIKSEAAKAIFEDMKNAVKLHKDTLEKYTKSLSEDLTFFNVVSKGAPGCASAIHTDWMKLSTHISYLTPLQWLSGIPSEKEWDLLSSHTYALEESGINFQDRIRETQIGDLVFLKGHGLYPGGKESPKARFGSLPHRSSDKIPECGQIAVAIF